MPSKPIVTVRVFMPQPPRPGNCLALSNLDIASRFQDPSLGELISFLNRESEKSTSDEIDTIEQLENLARTDPASVPVIVKALIGSIQGDEDREVALRCIAALERIATECPASAPTVTSSIVGILGHEELGGVILGLLIRLSETGGDELLLTLLESLARSVNKQPQNYKQSDVAQPELVYPSRSDATIRHLENLLKAIETILAESHSLTTGTLTLTAHALQNAWEHEEARRKTCFILSPISPIMLSNVLLALAGRFGGDDFVDFLIEKVMEQGGQEDNDLGNKGGRTILPIMPIFEAAAQALLLNPSDVGIQLWVGELIGSIKEDYESYSIIWMLGKIARFKQAAIPEDQIPTLITTIEHCLDSQNLQLAWRAVEAWGGMWCILDQDQQCRTITMLQYYLSPRSDWMIRVIAAQTLGEISVIAASEAVDNIATVLIGGKDDRGSNVRLAIVRALNYLVQYSPIHIPRVFTTFIGFLSDQCAEVREAAAEALQGLIKADPAYAATQLQVTVEAVGKAIALTPTMLYSLSPHHNHTLEIQALHNRARVAVLQVLHDIATISLPPGFGCKTA